MKIEAIINTLKDEKVKYAKSPESKGERAEECIVRSIKQLKYDEIVHFESGSYGDVDLKTDILIKLNNQWIAIQVKFKGGINPSTPFENLNITIKGIPVRLIDEILRPKKIVIDIWCNEIIDGFYSKESMEEIIRDINKGKTYFLLNEEYYISDDQKQEDAKKAEEEARRKKPSIMDFMSFKRGDTKENERRWKIAKKKYKEAIEKWKKENPDIVDTEDEEVTDE